MLMITTTKNHKLKFSFKTLLIEVKTVWKERTNCRITNTNLQATLSYRCYHLTRSNTLGKYFAFKQLVKHRAYLGQHEYMVIVVLAIQ